jgi:hypothetical protein
MTGLRQRGQLWGQRPLAPIREFRTPVDTKERRSDQELLMR